MPSGLQVSLHVLTEHVSQVSFNSKVDEGLRIQQLSGGQKSLVALATGMTQQAAILSESDCAFNSVCNPEMRSSTFLLIR